MKVDELNPALQDLVNGLKIGQISEVLSTTRSFQIFKLESQSKRKSKHSKSQTRRFASRCRGEVPR